MLKTLLASVMLSGLMAAGQADMASQATDRIEAHFGAVVAFADSIRSGGRPVWQMPAGRDGRAGGKVNEVVSIMVFPATR